MAAMDNGESERRSDLAVMDANEYKQKRRLERILDAHDDVEETASVAWELFATGDIGRDAKNILVQRAVKRAIREVYNLLIMHTEDVAEEGGADRYWQGDPNDPLGALSPTHGEDIPIVGLQAFLQTPEFYEETWEETVEHRNAKNETVTNVERNSLPEELSWAAFLRLKEFLATEHDLEIMFEEMEDDKLPMIRDFDQSKGNGETKSNDVIYQGTPDL